uniref:Uncharacterized protein n=1 Tax=Acrobeloides nanus TaxID=290746 RepID=A0A914DE16_9BILA
MINYGLKGLMRYAFSKMDSATNFPVECFYRHHSDIFIVYDVDNVLRGCGPKEDKASDQLEKNLQEFLEEMPFEMWWPLHKAYETGKFKKLKLGSGDRNADLAYLFEFLKATQEILHKTPEKRERVTNKYPDFRRVFTGDLHEPIRELVDAGVDIGLPKDTNHPGYDPWTIVKNIPHLFKAYKNGLKILIAAKEKLIELAEHEKSFINSKDDITNFLSREFNTPADSFYTRIGGLFDLADAYGDLCQKPIAWYNVPKYAEKLITC